MAKIPEQELERLKRDIDLAAIVRAKGIELKKHGRDLIGLCPFHDDKEPSLVITPAKNLWHCLGACQTGGSVIDWVMKSQGVSFRHAVEILRDKHSSIFSSRIKQIKQSRARKLAAPVEYTADDQTLLKQVIDYYHEILKKTPAALGYLKKRGIHCQKAIARFRIGFADRTLGLRLPNSQIKQGKEIRSRLTELGIYRKSGHEHFTGSLVIPIMDEHDNITEIYGRKINDNLRTGTNYHIYLPGPHKGIFNPGCFMLKEIILCESITLNAVLDKAFSLLQQQHFDIIEKRILEKKTFKEIAADVGKSERWCRKLYRQASCLLQEKYFGERF